MVNTSKGVEPARNLGSQRGSLRDHLQSEHTVGPCCPRSKQARDWGSVVGRTLSPRPWPWLSSHSLTSSFEKADTPRYPRKPQATQFSKVDL